jgi:hypothetical protein
LSNPVTTRTFSFDGMSKINGKLFDLNRIDFQVPFGQTERWRFSTNGNAPHPVHVHGASFQVQSRTGGRGTVYPWERGWKDTVLLAGLRDRRGADPLRRLPWQVPDPLPQARARGHGDDVQLRGHLSTEECTRGGPQAPPRVPPLFWSA